jgi:hypothetical protein
MGWGEAWRLTKLLLTDPSSQLAASVAGWPHPWPREAFVLADLYDLLHKVNAGKRKPKPYPRPGDKRHKRFGRATRPQQEIRAALLARGHGRALETVDDRGRRHGPDGRFLPTTTPKRR